MKKSQTPIYVDTYGKEVRIITDHERKTYRVGEHVIHEDIPKQLSKTSKYGDYGIDDDIRRYVNKSPTTTPVTHTTKTPLCVDIVAGSVYKECSAVAYGKDIHTITDHERKTYKIEDEALKHAVGGYFGKVPDDAYLCSPTPYGDLYKRFGWEQVTITLIPISTEVLECDTRETVVKSVICKNHKYKPQTVDVSLSETVCNSVSSVWKSHHNISCGQCIKYNISFGDTGSYDNSNIEFKHAWGKDETEYQDVTIGTYSGIKVALHPYEAVEARLVAYYGSMKVKVTYRATVSGGYAIVYKPSYKDNDFWCLPVTGALKGCGLETAKEVEEVLDINYYAGSYIELRDPKTNEVKRVVYGNELCAKDCY